MMKTGDRGSGIGDRVKRGLGPGIAMGFVLGLAALALLGASRLERALGPSNSPTFAGITLSGLTAGRVPFAGTGGLLSDDGNLVWDNTNKRLGIGTGSPSVPIHVYQNLGQGFYEMLRLSNTNGGVGTGSYVSFSSGGNPPIAYVGGLATGSNSFELRFYVANSAGNPFQAGTFSESGVLSLYSSVVLGAVTYANLASSGNGTITYCSNCTIANPCASGGTGALAKRLNGVWVCN